MTRASDKKWIDKIVNMLKEVKEEYMLRTPKERRKLLAAPIISAGEKDQPGYIWVAPYWAGTDTQAAKMWVGDGELLSLGVLYFDEDPSWGPMLDGFNDNFKYVGEAFANRVGKAKEAYEWAKETFILED